MTSLVVLLSFSNKTSAFLFEFRNKVINLKRMNRSIWLLEDFRICLEIQQKEIIFQAKLTKLCNNTLNK